MAPHRRIHQRDRSSPTSQTLYCVGSSQWHRQDLVQEGHKTTRNSLLHIKWHDMIHWSEQGSYSLAATELPQLLLQNTNMFEETAAQSCCQNLCSSKVNWWKIDCWKLRGHVPQCPIAADANSPPFRNCWDDWHPSMLKNARILVRIFSFDHQTISSALLLALVHVLEIEHSPLPDHTFGIVITHMSIDLICPWTVFTGNWKLI